MDLAVLLLPVVVGAVAVGREQVGRDGEGILPEGVEEVATEPEGAVRLHRSPFRRGGAHHGHSLFCIPPFLAAV